MRLSHDFAILLWWGFRGGTVHNECTSHHSIALQLLFPLLSHLTVSPYKLIKLSCPVPVLNRDQFLFFLLEQNVLLLGAPGRSEGGPHFGTEFDG